jgi:hypothetical protein
VNAVSRIIEVLADVIVFNGWIVEVVEIVNDRDLCGIAREQTIDEVRPDKPRAACDEKPFH